MLINCTNVKRGLIEIANQKLNPLREASGYRPVSRVSSQTLERVDRATWRAMVEEVANHRAGSKSITLK